MRTVKPPRKYPDWVYRAALAAWDSVPLYDGASYDLSMKRSDLRSLREAIWGAYQGGEGLL